MELVSIIIPCYNMGTYIEETLKSISEQTYPNIEVVVVNDGSTDLGTIEVLDRLLYPKLKIINTSNQGLGAARNTAIANSSGDFILPLDADDIICPTYVEKAVNVLNNNPLIKIVYCKAELFGEDSGEWGTDYLFEEMLEHNLIFCTALYRRKDYDLTKGYNASMSYMGWEDWDFWLSLIENSQNPEMAAYRIPEILFRYRIRNRSMIRVLDEIKDNTLRKEVFLNHINLYSKHFETPIVLKHKLKNLENEFDKLSRNYDGILNSKSYKIGTFLLWPFKKILCH